MIEVKFDPQKLTGQLKIEWDAWQKKADAATDEVIKAWEDWRKNGSPGEFKYKFNDLIWGELKEWLVKNVFGDKCAYCETREIRSPYHAEHFRPKGLVTNKTEKKKQQVCTTLDENGKAIKHPGYFWLAYNWANLLPSCNNCNTAQGKKNQFPVNKSHVSVKRLTQNEVLKLRKKIIQSKSHGDIYYLQPEDLNEMEDPLLLHPYWDNPQDHLTFGDFGVVVARENSEKGKHSIEVFNLDSGSIIAARQTAQENAFRDYVAEINKGRNVSIAARIEAGKAAIAEYIKGTAPYSAAVMAYLRGFFPGHGL